MYVLENPVLQRELLMNLRMTRGFVLLFAYVALLGMLVYLAWPREQVLDLSRPVAAQRLVNLFFLGQYLLASLMAPSFAAGAIAGEKERKSFEMLLASPLRPASIVIGKLVASLCHLAILMFCSLPIVMLCLPLGGVHPNEVFAAYFAMLATIGLFGMISIWCSSYFQRTSASLVVSYLLILPLALLGVLAWNQLQQYGQQRLLVVVTVVPAVCISLGAMLWRDTCRRLLDRPDLGTEGKDVIDLEREAEEAVGLYIKRDEFPDKLFAPPKRTTFIDDKTNPIYDKEMRSEIFAQGTLMLRLVIQVSMGLALPAMGFCLFIWPAYAAWYISYVLLFNMMVGPVFSAGSVTGERERQTLDLLLTTLITPWQMLWGKLFSGLRVSGVLTAFLLWPLFLACIMPIGYWSSLPTMFGYVLIVALTCVTTAVTALFCSTLCNRSSVSMMATYLVIIAMFTVPVAATQFAETFFAGTTAPQVVRYTGVTSPFMAAFSLPLDVADSSGRIPPGQPDLALFFGYCGFSVLYNGLLLAAMMWLLKVRWRVAE